MLKKSFFYALIMLFQAAAFCGTARAKVYIDLAAPAVKKMPVAIQEFKYTGAEPSNPQEAAAVKTVRAELADALRSDLTFSNLFDIIDKQAYLEDPAKAGLAKEEIKFQDWRAIGADVLIKGTFKLEKDQLTVEVRLYDCVNEAEVLGRRYVGNLANPRRMVHYFADQIYEELTGRKGIFTTKLLFLSDKGGNKEVYTADYDGKNAWQLTRNRSINLSPQWSPDGKKIIYTSYRKGWPCLYMLDLRSGETAAISDKPGINIGARFSPDGKAVALTLSGDKSPELYTLELATLKYRRLTDNYSIDVSPSWSPDGKRLAYISDISGNPHIFVLDLDGGATTRLTYSGKYNATPSWSPDGKLIAFARADGGGFNIWVMRSDGSGAAQLTFEGDNRAPSWSPDGRYIVYSSSVKGASDLYIMRSDGTGVKKVGTGIGKESSPAWSPFMQ